MNRKRNKLKKGNELQNRRWSVGSRAERELTGQSHSEISEREAREIGGQAERSRWRDGWL